MSVTIDSMEDLFKKKILVAEDDDSLRSILVSQLKLEEFIVVEASNGEEGLKLSLQEKPDLILLDIIMTKMNGMVMLKKMKEDSRIKNIPVIILSNLNDVPQIIQTLEFGTDIDKDKYNTLFSADTASDYTKKYLKARFNDDGYDFIIKSNISLEDLIRRINNLIEVHQV